MTEFDVAVVGYGPVGMIMSALLGRAGHRVVVLERYSGLYNLPRAAIFDDETMRTFARLGIAEVMLPKVHASRRYEWQNGEGEMLIEHDFALVGKSGWAEWYMMYQPHLEEALDEAVRKTGNVEVQFDARVTGYTQHHDHVRIDTERGAFDAKWVLACDGGNSFTREHLGIEMTNFGFSEPWMVCDFAFKEPESAPVIPWSRQVCDPRQPQSIISLGPKHHRFSFMLDSEEAFAKNSEPERVWQRVAKYLKPSEADLVRVATYTFRSLVAHRWHQGRIILAGDAAHQMPPFLGQGMCSGIRDAQNLAFKLELLLSKQADEKILDTYQSEREPHVVAVIQKGIELGRVQTMRDREKAAARDQKFFANRAEKRAPDKIRMPNIGAGLLSASPGAGELFPQGNVSGRRFDDVAGYGWFLLGTESFANELRDAASPAKTYVLAAPGSDAPGALTDSDGTYVRWFAEHDAKAVVVRPDFYVYGTAHDGPSLCALLSELRGHIT